mmetsp:Transcript_14782/g.32690  ORF Transcript_14782/g.32690 Transcript_14782/m.32690 type:complete len:735 (-) Transcript_14782:184-2388(-)
MHQIVQNLEHSPIPQCSNPHQHHHHGSQHLLNYQSHDHCPILPNFYHQEQELMHSNSPFSSNGHGDIFVGENYPSKRSINMNYDHYHSPQKNFDKTDRQPSGYNSNHNQSGCQNWQSLCHHMNGNSSMTRSLIDEEEEVTETDENGVDGTDGGNISRRRRTGTMKRNDRGNNKKEIGVDESNWGSDDGGSISRRRRYDNIDRNHRRNMKKEIETDGNILDNDDNSSIRRRRRNDAIHKDNRRAKIEEFGMDENSRGSNDGGSNRRRRRYERDDRHNRESHVSFSSHHISSSPCSTIFPPRIGKQQQNMLVRKTSSSRDDRSNFNNGIFDNTNRSNGRYKHHGCRRSNVASRSSIFVRRNNDDRCGSAGRTYSISRRCNFGRDDDGNWNDSGSISDSSGRCLHYDDEKVTDDVDGDKALHHYHYRPNKSFEEMSMVSSSYHKEGGFDHLHHEQNRYHSQNLEDIVSPIVQIRNNYHSNDIIVEQRGQKTNDYNGEENNEFGMKIICQPSSKYNHDKYTVPSNDAIIHKGCGNRIKLRDIHTNSRSHHYLAQSLNESDNKDDDEELPKICNSSISNVGKNRSFPSNSPFRTPVRSGKKEQQLSVMASAMEKSDCLKHMSINEKKTGSVSSITVTTTATTLANGIQSTPNSFFRSRYRSTLSEQNRMQQGTLTSFQKLSLKSLDNVNQYQGLLSQQRQQYQKQQNSAESYSHGNNIDAVSKENTIRIQPIYSYECGV